MNSLYDFIVKPIGQGRYTNSKKINGKELILNTKIESWKFVNRFASNILGVTISAIGKSNFL